MSKNSDISLNVEVLASYDKLTTSKYGCVYKTYVRKLLNK